MFVDEGQSRFERVECDLSDVLGTPGTGDPAEAADRIGAALNHSVESVAGGDEWYLRSAEGVGAFGPPPERILEATSTAVDEVLIQPSDASRIVAQMASPWRAPGAHPTGARPPGDRRRVPAEHHARRPGRRLAILRRTNPRPRMDWADRAVFAALIRWLPQAPRCHRLITLNTILRWHRRLVRRRWTCLSRPGRPLINHILVALVERVTREIRAGGTGGSRVSCSNWAIGSAPRRSVGSSSATGSHRRQSGTPTPAGSGSCARRPPARWRSTSSTSTARWHFAVLRDA